MTIRPRRSLLYMPGSNPRTLEKAKTLPADILVFDLEDAVADAAKPQARQAIADALRAGGYGSRELLVRINALDTPWGADDVAALKACGADGLLLPKAEGAEDIRSLAGLLAGTDTRIWCMMERPRAILNAAAIADAHPSLAGFVMGTSDLAKDLGARHVAGRLPLLFSLSQCLLAARAAGIAIIDGVHLDLDDDAGLACACRQGAELGFDGKSLIHPKQLAAANLAFAPSPAMIEQARRMIAGFAAAQAEGKAVAVVDGQLVEALHVAEARQMLALAERIART